EPPERIGTGKFLAHPVRNAAPAHAVIAVAAGDEVAAELMDGIALREANARLGRIEIQRRDVAHVEQHASTGGDARMDQILDELVLRVQHDSPAIGQLGERDPMTAAGEAQLDAAMNRAL